MHMRPSIPRPQPVGRLAGLAAVVVLVCAAGVHGQDSQPATAPASSPAPGPAELAWPAEKLEYPPIREAATVAEALALTRGEESMLSAVRQGNKQRDEAGFYVMLRHAAMLPRGRATLAKADRVPVRNLLDDPEHYRLRTVPGASQVDPTRPNAPSSYRLQLIRMEVIVYRVSRWHASAITPTAMWGQRNYWQLDCKEVGTGEPLIVFVTDEPAGLAEGEHAKGVRVEVAGLFYKLLRKKALNEQERLYPVLTAAEVLTSKRAGSSGWGRMPPGYALVTGLLAVLLGVFLFIKRWTRRPRPAGRQYRPLRQQALGDDVDEPIADESVDEELARQVRQYKAEHGQEDGA